MARTKEIRTIFYGFDNGAPNDDEVYEVSITPDGRNVRLKDNLDGTIRVFPAKVALKLGEILIEVAGICQKNRRDTGSPEEEDGKR